MTAQLPSVPHPLRVLRANEDLTQAKLARRAHVSLRTVVYIEGWKHQPREYTRYRLLRALGLPPEEFLGMHFKIFGELPTYPRHEEKR